MDSWIGMPENEGIPIHSPLVAGVANLSRYPVGFNI